MQCARSAIGFLAVFLALGPTLARATGRELTIEDAKTLMLSGQTNDARSLLQHLSPRDPSNNDIAFLLGLLAIDARDYRQAIGYFRAILVREPAALRVRLELARAFYLSHDYENAFRQFQFARAGNLPPGVSTSIDRYVAAIRHEKSWSYNVSFGVAPDTNINNGTSSREAVIFGLPFELSDDARQRSGTGGVMAASGEFAPQLGERIRLRVGSAVERREYKGTSFDDMTVAAYAGPRVEIDRWDLSVLGTGFRRWFGGRQLNQGFGARIEASRMGTRTSISLGISALRLRYSDYSVQDGRAMSASIGAVRALTPASAINGRIGIGRRGAKTSELANWSGWFAVGYYRDLPGGFSFYAEPAYSRTRYDAADPFFGRRRVDRLLELQLALLNRRLVLSRFTPRLGLTLARRRSTIGLYDYSQRRIEAGFTSAF